MSENNRGHQDRSLGRRRFPRVELGDSVLVGAQVRWPNLETTRIRDLSYLGAAAFKPALEALTLRRSIEVEVLLEAEVLISIAARVVWLSDDQVGLEFADMPLDSRIALDRFLAARLTGLQMTKVDRRHFGRGDDFSDWYAGPGNTHVFLWVDLGRSQITKAIVQFDEEIVTYDHGNVFSSSPVDARRFFRRALALLSQLPDAPRSLSQVIEALAKSW